MARAVVSSGRFTASQEDATVRPRLNYTNPPILCFHSASNSAADAIGPVNQTVGRITARLADDGYTTVCPFTPGYWGSGSASNEAATAMGRGTDALTYATATLGQSSSDPGVIGVSMGSVAALRYAALHTVAWCLTLLTICDLDYIYQNDTGGSGFRAQIGTAYGVTYPTALPNDATPMDLTTELSAVPLMCLSASDDDFSHNIASFVSATGATHIDAGALGHTDTASAQISIPQVREFVVDNFA